jgi:hypothetical protein
MIILGKSVNMTNRPAKYKVSLKNRIKEWVHKVKEAKK